MNMTLKTVFAATALSLAIGGVAIANAKPNQGNDKQHHCMNKKMKGHHPMNMQMPHKPFFLHGIELTSEQEDKIFALTHAEAPKIRDRMKARHQLRQDLMLLVQTNTFNEVKAREIAAKIAEIESENELAKARTDNKILNVLNAEQRAQVIKNKEKLKQNSTFKRSHGKAGFSEKQANHPVTI